MTISCTTMTKQPERSVNDLKLLDIEKINAKLEMEIKEKSQKILTPIYGEDNYNVVVTVLATLSQCDEKRNELVPINKENDDPKTPYDESKIQNIYTVISNTRNEKESYTGTGLTMPPGYENMSSTSTNSNNKYKYERTESYTHYKYTTTEIQKKYDKLEIQNISVSIAINLQVLKDKSSVKTDKMKIESLINGILQGYANGHIARNQNNIFIEYINYY